MEIKLQGNNSSAEINSLRMPFYNIHLHFITTTLPSTINVVVNVRCVIRTEPFNHFDSQNLNNIEIFNIPEIFSEYLRRPTLMKNMNGSNTHPIYNISSIRIIFHNSFLKYFESFILSAI